MSDPFIQKRGQVFEIRDDDDARAFLLRLGILDKFSKRAQLAGEWAESVGHADHPTHWILATRFSGFSDALENGFVVQGWPKTLYSLERINALLHARNQKLFPGGLEVERYDSIDPQRN